MPCWKAASRAARSCWRGGSSSQDAMVRDARRCRAPHHEAVKKYEDLILRRREAPSRRMRHEAGYALRDRLNDTAFDPQGGAIGRGGLFRGDVEHHVGDLLDAGE